MEDRTKELLESKLDAESRDRLLALPCRAVHEFVAKAIDLCKPKSVRVLSDDPADEAYVRQLAMEDGSETALAMEGHTIHYDGYNDQARDKANTRYLLPEGEDLGSRINSISKAEGLPEILGFLDGAMAASGTTMLVCFHCLGPTNSVFSIPVVQVTDSSYVAHSINLLYRPGYEQFKSV